MAPKRSAPLPPPPPPAASSEETASGSGSEEEEEEEEEEEIAHSPPPAAPKRIAPPPQKDLESEASSDEDEDEDDEEEDGEEEDEKANHVVPSSATKNPPPPPPPTREKSGTSDEEEEEEEEEEADDEMPQMKPAPNQEMEAKGAKRPPFQRTWSTDDEVRILEALAAHRLEHGTLPQTDVLADALAGKLDNSGCSLSKLKRKVKNLQTQSTKAVKNGALPSKDHDRRLLDLFKNVWPSVTKAAANSDSGAGREPDEMCELYPFLAEEVKVLQKEHPGLFKREFAMIDDSKARALDEKTKRQRRAQMKLRLSRHDLTKAVTKTLMDLAE